jgi:hypothetical protein
MKESDWKRYKKIRADALEAYCELVLAACVEIASPNGESAHTRYLKMFDMIAERDRALADMFDGLSRSSASVQLSLMVRRGLVGESQVIEFTDEFRDEVRRLAGLH